MAELSTIGGIFKPSPPVDPTNGAFTYMGDWGDLTNDSSTNIYTVSTYAGTAMKGSATAGGAFRHSGRSIEVITAPFTIVLDGQFSQNAGIGLNIEGTATYPDPRYNRSKYAYTTQTVATTGQQTRPFESGVLMGGAPAAHSWLSSAAAVWVAICDNGTSVKYAVSADNGATWTVKYTSLAVYVPAQNFKVDVYALWGSQAVMVRKYSTALF